MLILTLSSINATYWVAGVSHCVEAVSVISSKYKLLCRVVAPHGSRNSYCEYEVALSETYLDNCHCGSFNDCYMRSRIPYL